MKQNAITVIIPAYNAQDTIEKCLDSLLSQTIFPESILVVDDGSQDSTGEICDRYAQRYPIINIIHQNNKGVSAARNIGLQACDTEYITFIDSDDYVGPSFIEILMGNTGCDFVTCGFHLQNRERIWEDILFPNDQQKISVIKSRPAEYMGKYYFGSPWAKLFKKTLIDKWNLQFDTQMKNGEDTLFIFDYLEHVADIKIVSMIDYYYTYQPKSLSHIVHINYWQWRLVQEKKIQDFFTCSEANEIESAMEREFFTLMELLHMYYKTWDAKQINTLYQDSLFERSILYKKKNGNLDEKALLFSLDHKVYPAYECYKHVRSFMNRAKGHFHRKFSALFTN